MLENSQLNNPKISVIITSYNRANYISKAIESVLDSTFEDFELIISDDCSKDDSFIIACQYALKDNRVSVYRNEKNIGDYPNRILSIGRSKSNWIKFVDCDDYISKDCLLIMYSFAVKSSLNFGICAPGVKECSVLSSKEAFNSGFLSYYGPTGTFFNKKSYLSLGGFVNRITVSDWHMWHRFSMNSDIMIYPEDLVTWRDHEENTLKTDSHKYGVIRFYLLSLYEILSDSKCPIDYKSKSIKFKNEVFDIFKYSLKFAFFRKSVLPIIMFLKYNFKYVFSHKLK